MSGRVVSFLLLFTVVAVLSSLANVASIQDSAPPGLDLAALTLRPGDVAEPGWKHAGAFMEDLASEAEIAASYRGDGSTAEDASEQLVAFGWRRMYVDVLDGPTGANAAPNRRIRSYITEYASAEGAAAGFLYLEDEGAIASAEDVPGTRPFGEQFELTSDKGTSGVDGRPFRSLDLTFRAGNLVAGVT